MNKQFIVLARPTDENNTHYLLTHVPVEAKNWAEAYQMVRNQGFSLFIDEYEPAPSTSR